MPLTLINARMLFFGQADPTELPKLPDGFTYKMVPDEWVLAVAPDGTEYLSGKFELTLYATATEADELRTKGRLKTGERFMDDRLKIPLG